MKKKVLQIRPISEKAKQRFSEYMDLIHTCKIDQETETEWLLTSANKKYKFIVSKVNDKHWQISK